MKKNLTSLRSVNGHSRGGRLRTVQTPLGDPDASLRKWSTRRVIVSGNVVEMYQYPQPYFYNWGPGKQSHGDGVVRAAKKRDDHILRARRMIRRLINANTATETPKFITLTFANNVRSLAEANPQFSKFTKELQRRCGKTRYLCVPEFQKRGAVHYHVIYFDLPYVQRLKELIQKLWPHGFVKVIAVREIRNIGAYVSKYLQKGVGDARTVMKKGYFCSRRMQKPQEIRDESRIDNFLSSCTLEIEAAEKFESRQGTISYVRSIRRDL